MNGNICYRQGFTSDEQTGKFQKFLNSNVAQIETVSVVITNKIEQTLEIYSILENKFLFVAVMYIINNKISNLKLYIMHFHLYLNHNHTIHW